MLYNQEYLEEGSISIFNGINEDQIQPLQFYTSEDRKDVYRPTSSSMPFKFFFSFITHTLQSNKSGVAFPHLSNTSGLASSHFDAGWISTVGGAYIPGSHFNTRMSRNNLNTQEIDCKANEYILQNLN